jgi:hypothetical protein
MQKAEWDSEAWRLERDRKLREWIKNESAVQCVIMLSGISELWDDLIDEEVVPEQRVHRAFVQAIVGLQFNAFWSDHKHMLMPVVIVAINAWMDANVMQRAEDRNERILAYSLRNLTYELASMAAFCVSGWEGMRDVSLEMRRFFINDRYDDWEHAK